MSAMLPMAVYGLEVPAGDIAIPAKSDIPSAFRITMAAIDPSAEPEGEEGAIPRATLKIIRQSLEYDDESDDEDEEDFDIEEMERMLAENEDDDEEDSEDEDLNGAGPSDPTKTKQARKAAAEKAIKEMLEEEGMDVDEMPNGVNGVKKSAKALGKMPASDDSEDEDEDDSDDGEEWEEFVICTLDPNSHYNQPLDITVGERERVLFKVSGTHSVFLTGNYVEPAGHEHGPDMYDPDSDEEMEYDLEPDSDELGSDEEDELDGMEDPRIMELEDEDEDEAPELIQAPKKEKKEKKDKKGKNKRPAEDEEDEATADGETIDAMIAEEVKKDEQKLSKKQLKKLKKNDGSAAVVAAAKEVEAPSSTKSDKKVSFAKELEQGPTPTKDGKEKPKGSLGVKVVQGVTIDDKKLGTGPASKNGDRVSMRYIGKLKDGKVFDACKKGKPFSFKLGAGEVIKGWDIGVAGMSAGGERRITIPAHLAYGSKGVPGIPGNSALTFDVKLLEISKK